MNYTHEDKQQLADKIATLKKKEDFVKIFEIIYEENKSFSDKPSGIFLYFHKLSDATYTKIDEYLQDLEKKKRVQSNSSPENKVFNTTDEFGGYSNIGAKYKISNKEKNIIKRCRYDSTLASETNSDVMYKEFDAAMFSETESDQAQPTNKTVSKGKSKKAAPKKQAAKSKKIDSNTVKQ